MSKFGKIALCLAGGGSRGIIQLGMMKAWRDFGLEYDILFGTSVGALNGSMLHQGDLDLTEELWLSISNDQVYKKWPWDYLQVFTDHACVYDSTPLLNLCQYYINPAKIKSNPKPFFVNSTQIFNLQEPVAYDLKTPEDDEIPLYVKASANPPVYFSPVEFRGMKLVDGGLVNNFSVMSAISAGADTIVVMTPSKPVPKDPKNLLDMVGIVTSVPENEFLDRELSFIDFIDKVQAPFADLKSIKKVVIRPPQAIDIDFMNFNYSQDRKELIQIGYDIAINILKQECS